MTYFSKPDHKYNRAIFEFTDTEIKASGYHRFTLQPTKLEMIQLLQRIETSEKENNGK